MELENLDLGNIISLDLSEELTEEDLQTNPEDNRELITRLTAFLEEQFQLNRRYPSVELIKFHFKINKNTLEKLLGEDISEKLKARGLPVYYAKRNSKIQKKDSFESNLDPLFIMACNKILDPSSTKSFSARMKELEPLGIDTRKWSNWLTIPEYAHYAKTMFNKKFDTEVELNAQMNLARNVQAGDLSSIKFYYELTNKFRPSDPTQVALIGLIHQLMQIISRHVSPEVIDVIADELDSTELRQLMP